MGSGFSKMKKQARLMQEQMSQQKEKMEAISVEASSGNGLVKVVLNGHKDLKKISINPECTGDIEALEDLIIAAFQKAALLIEENSPSFPSGLF